MILGQLCAETLKLEYISRIIQPLVMQGPQNLDIRGLAYDSRHVQPGFLFIALRGQHQNGTHYVEEAIRRGAVAVVTEGNGWTRAMWPIFASKMPGVPWPKSPAHFTIIPRAI